MQEMTSRSVSDHVRSKTKTLIFVWAASVAARFLHPWLPS